MDTVTEDPGVEVAFLPEEATAHLEVALEDQGEGQARPLAEVDIVMDEAIIPVGEVALARLQLELALEWPSEA